MKKIFLLLPVLAFLAVACGETATAPDPMEPELVVMFSTSELPFSLEWDGTGSDSEECYVPEEDDPRYPFYEAGSGWIHWNVTQGGDVEQGAKLVLGGTGSGEYDETGRRPVVEFFTPYFEVDGLEATFHYDGTLGGNPQFVISDYCPPGTFERLDVSKTAVTSFTREHFWDIDKKVETKNGYELDDIAKVWLYIDGSGDETATWTVDVTYEDYEDSDFNVSGEITIENTGTLDAVITAIDDVLGGTAITVDCGEGFELPYTLPVGESLTCYYDEDGYVENFNEVTVITERDEYFADAEIIWGEPDEEINKTVNIKDVSDLFGEVGLGSVTAPNGDTFTYDKDFAWANYVADLCGSYTYDNTATIVETGQDADATLKVNVQCFIYDSAWAKGDPNVPFCNYFDNWGWTNPITPDTYEWPLWAGAAQCDVTKGELVGSVTVVYDEITFAVTVTFNVAEDYDLKETHVYAGYDMFPKDRRGRDTVAPGLYTNNSPFDGSQVYVIAHAVVGYPDPDFGP